MATSNLEILDINFIVEFSDSLVEKLVFRVSFDFQNTSWYEGVMYFLHNLQATPEMRRTKARFLKLKATKFCILYGKLY